MTFGVIYIITEEWRDDFTVDVLYSAPETIFPSPFHGSRASRNEKHTHLQLRTSTYQHKTNLPFFNFFKLLAFVIIILYTKKTENTLTQTGLLGIRPTQPYIPPESVNEYQLRLGRERQVCFIPSADKCRVCR